VTFQSTLLTWYAEHKRDLPWRHTTDPYKVLVSEIMLQQTQVSRVVPIYNKFIAQFPTADALSKAELGSVLKAWKGLGYNRRAKFLWELSRKLPYGKKGEKELPDTEAALKELPGIGHYTAAAILAFSHNRDAVPIDTNIRRIYHRYFRDASEAKVGATLPKGQARDWNSALMDFGSLVCAKNPQCTHCPLQKDCKAYKEQDFAVPVPKQSTFKESNRYYRGRILDMLREGPKTKQELLNIGEKEKVLAATQQLLDEKLIKQNNKKYNL
jgi:A/G-specific adenine glycosylase